MSTIERKNAASKMALLEYKFQLLIITLIVAVLFFFGVTVEERQNFVGVIVSLIMGIVVATFAKELYFSKKLLKKYNEEELRRMWLRFGGFSED